ncbi:MAG: stage IV sporulation protein A [Lachnospiraceae bacterium]|nr:stage IV sporulation protein A [Lachnospiraceae bacterium]
MDIYKDIEQRTNKEIYIGVVGPVRTGKSTFIKRFMEMLVIPAIDEENSRIRAKDELPQSAAGKTVMTTEPKFIPKEAVDITVGDGVNLKVRMIDCVGYMVDGAEGHEEDGKERLVTTPWFDYDIPFTEAASIGTRKVIKDHSTVGMVITSDGSITDIDRTSYIEPEQKTIGELNELGKPFVILLNSRHPNSEETVEMAGELSEKYNKTVIPINCDKLNEDDINMIFESLLMEFPVTAVNFNIPKWVEALDNDNEIKEYLIDLAKDAFSNIYFMRDVKNLKVNSDDYIEKIDLSNMNLADGNVNITIKLFDKYYYDMISKLLGNDIKNEYEFMKEIKELAETKNSCKKVSEALSRSLETGYGSVSPEKEDIKLDTPELIKSGNKYGVKIKAEAPSIHLIKANITTEIAPIVGSEEQAKDLIDYINSDGTENNDIWSVNIFGKTIRQLVEDGLQSKIDKINQESQLKLQDTMEKIVNDSNGGMVCIII